MSTKPTSLSAMSLPGTLASVLHDLPEFKELSPQARQNMCSAVRRFCQVIERSPENVPANPKILETLFERAAPGTLGLSPTRWRNIKSDVRRAVKLLGEHQLASGATVPLSDTWEARCRSGPHPTVRAVLRRLGRSCCARQISPTQVTDRLSGTSPKPSTSTV